MKFRIIILVMIMAGQVWGQNKKSFPSMHGCFVHPKMDLIVSGHRNIAFIGEYGYLSRRVDENSISTMDSVLSKASISLARLYYELWNQNREDFRVKCQHPDTTYALLNRNGIDTKDLAFYNRREIAAILGVDAVVTVHCLVFKKYTPAETTMINIASVAATFGLAMTGTYTAYFPFQAGVDVFYLSTTIHDASGEMIYMDKGLETAFPKLNPGGIRYMRNQPDFPYLK